MNLDARILHHLAGTEIAEQGDLLDKLKADGFELTLSTLSRHLKKLHVRKEAGRYRQVEAARPGPDFTLTKVPPILLVLRTAPGFAQALALALDAAQPPSLAGTVAGDDTIFAAPLSADRLDQLEAEIRGLL